MDIYLIACFVAIICLSFSLLFTNHRIKELNKEIDDLNDRIDYLDFK